MDGITMKKLISSIFLLTAIALNACWFTEANFNAVYIAGVNNYISHNEETDNLAAATYHNGQTVALPLTVWVKVSPRMADQQGEAAGTKDVVRAVLQYKVLPNGNWITVKDLAYLDWRLAFDKRIPLFGTSNINPNVPDNTELLIRIYVTDGTYENGDLNSDISAFVPATITGNSTSFNGWSAPHIMRVKIGGLRPFR